MQTKEEEFQKFLVVNQGLVGSTVHTYLNRFQRIKRWLHENNLELTQQSVVDFLFEKTEQELSNSTINTYRQTFIHIDLYCKSHGLPYGFTEGTKNLPKIQPEIIILSEEELERLLDTHLTYKNRNGVDCSTLDDKYLTLTMFLAYTGCRFEEAASLKIKRLDIGNGKATLVDTKNKQNRFVYFEGAPIKEALTKLIKDRDPEDLVFTGSTGKHVIPGTFNDNIRLRAQKAGINKRTHAHLLRHSFATHLLMAGNDITIVSTLLGHKDIRTTYETYVHLADTALQKGAQKHPLMRKFISAEEKIKEAVEMLEKLNLGSDSRLIYNLIQNNSSLEFKLSLNPQ